MKGCTPLVPLILLMAGFAAPAISASAGILDMDDAAIAHAMITVNGIAIETGNLAQSRSSSEKIKAYAEQMAAHHADVSRSVTELAAKLDLTPHDNAISKELRADSEKDIARLKALDGAEFDKAFIEQNIALHQNTLDSIDNTLMPKVKNQELKALLFNLFEPYSEHLRQAQQIQRTLGSGG